uniref:Protein phosphatase 1 regulatory subunit 42 n=1 Tax=Timema monikensis TaxID=170555 RepID=A0A7R9E012_9NEOP|nr:unnamed protein product [Timema monikensis]
MLRHEPPPLPPKKNSSGYNHGITLHPYHTFSKGDISRCKNLTVLYLHNNFIEKIGNLQHAVNLTHLYLQKNKISKIENLQYLKNLKKLYLSRNCIAVLEGLEALTNLEELHIDKQQLPPGESLYFDPRTIKTLSTCVRVLNLSNNNLISITDLTPLQEIRWFISRDNQLSDLGDICSTVQQWPYIGCVEIQGNPVCTVLKYRDKIIGAASSSLASLDGKDVTETTRTFLKRFEWNKANNMKKTESTPKIHPVVSKNVKSLARQFPIGVQQTISHTILADAEMMGFPVKRNSSTNMFPGWRNRDEEAECSSKINIPRLFLRHTSTSHIDKKQDKADGCNITALQL